MLLSAAKQDGSNWEEELIKQIRVQARKRKSAGAERRAAISLKVNVCLDDGCRGVSCPNKWQRKGPGARWHLPSSLMAELELRGD